MKVSMIVPVYNTDKALLERCINSLTSQTFTDIEVILVDDGSEITVESILANDRAFDSRINVIRQRNCGVSAARNMGMNFASGEYFTFVDSDDYIDRYWIERSVDIAEKENADIVIGKVTSCSGDDIDMSNTAEVGSVAYGKSDILELQNMILYNDYSPFHNMSHVDLGVCGKLYRRELLNGMCFQTDIALSEDQLFVHEAIRKSRKIIVTNLNAYYYIANKDSASHSYQKKGISTIRLAMTLLNEKLLDSNKQKNAYAYRVVMDYMLGIEMQYFNESTPKENWHKKWGQLSADLRDSLYVESLKNVSIRRRQHMRRRIKFIILRYAARPFFFIKELKLRVATRVSNTKIINRR